MKTLTCEKIRNRIIQKIKENTSQVHFDLVGTVQESFDDFVTRGDIAILVVNLIENRQIILEIDGWHVIP